jgi:hypothetical protein
MLPYEFKILILGGSEAILTGEYPGYRKENNRPCHKFLRTSKGSNLRGIRYRYGLGAGCKVVCKAAGMRGNSILFRFGNDPVRGWNVERELQIY